MYGLCSLLLIFQHRQLAPFVGRVDFKPYYRFPNKELHGTYSFNGDYQQCSER